MQQAQQIINSQADISLGIKRSAWLLFQHELSRINPETNKPFTVNHALTNVLKWMAGQKAMQSFRQLSPREREIIGMIVEGLTQQQIALELGCKLGTVKIHLTRIRQKVGAVSTYQVVAIAVERGWIQAPRVDE